MHWLTQFKMCQLQLQLFLCITMSPIWFQYCHFFTTGRLQRHRFILVEPFAQDMQWGQGLQLIEDFDVANGGSGAGDRADRSVAPAPFVVTEGEERSREQKTPKQGFVRKFGAWFTNLSRHQIFRLQLFFPFPQARGQWIQIFEMGAPGVVAHGAHECAVPPDLSVTWLDDMQDLTLTNTPWGWICQANKYSKMM